LDIFVDIKDKEKASEWFLEFEFWTKTIPETRYYPIKEKQMLFCKLRHYIHSGLVKQKQENREIKHIQSSCTQNTNYIATIYL
ncbi:29337_t:CDS:1, partial [Racocetra persica]